MLFRHVVLGGIRSETETKTESVGTRARSGMFAFDGHWGSRVSQVQLECRDAHLRHDLQNAGIHRMMTILIQIIDGLVVLDADLV
jgi:hypothetical protein